MFISIPFFSKINPPLKLPTVELNFKFPALPFEDNSLLIDFIKSSLTNFCPSAFKIRFSSPVIAKEVTKAVDSMVSYLGIVNKEVTEDTKIVVLDNYLSKETESTIQELKDKNLNPILIGDGKYIINQYPLKKTKVVADSKVLLVTNSTNIVLPDFTGWTYNEVNTYASLVGIKVNMSGYGYVVGQSIPPNSPVTKDLIVDLTLSK